MRDVCVVALAVALCAVAAIKRAANADAPQVAPATTVMLVLGWDVATHAIVYADALPFSDAWQCEEARDMNTPRSNNKLSYRSQCITPTDAPT